MATRVLIVDDSAFARTLLRDAVTAGGMEVVAEAANAEEATAQWSALRPDLVTLDLVMPGRSGLQWLAEVMALEPRTRVVVVTSAREPGLLDGALRAGARDVVTKPFASESLVQRLLRAAG